MNGVTNAPRLWVLATGTASSACSRTCCSTSSSSPAVPRSCSCRRTRCSAASAGARHRAAARQPVLRLPRLAAEQGRGAAATSRPCPTGRACRTCSSSCSWSCCRCYLETKDATLAWYAGLAWCFIIGVIVLPGAFVGPAIRAMTPRAAMLGTPAGISIAFISMRPAFQMWETPWIGLACFAIVLVAWTANGRCPAACLAGWSR